MMFYILGVNTKYILYSMGFFVFLLAVKWPILVKEGIYYILSARNIPTDSLPIHKLCLACRKTAIEGWYCM